MCLCGRLAFLLDSSAFLCVHFMSLSRFTEALAGLYNNPSIGGRMTRAMEYKVL